MAQWVGWCLCAPIRLWFLGRKQIGQEVGIGQLAILVLVLKLTHLFQMHTFTTQPQVLTALICLKHQTTDGKPWVFEIQYIDIYFGEGQGPIHQHNSYFLPKISLLNSGVCTYTLFRGIRWNHEYKWEKVGKEKNQALRIALRNSLQIF